MRLAIIGTSNSIMQDGYTAGLARHPHVTRLDNLSLGASTSVVLSKIAAEATPDRYDFVFLDFAVNEEVFVANKAVAIDEIDGRLKEFLSHLRGGAIPVVVIMPATVGLPAQLPVHAFYRSFALQHGYPLFDGFAFLDRLAKAMNVGNNTLFLDEAHMARWAAWAFGYLMAGQLRRMKKERPQVTTRSDCVPEHQYRSFRPEEITGGTMVNRCSSLTKIELAQLAPGHSVAVTLDEERTMVALGVNLTHSNASALIRSEDGRRMMNAATHFGRGRLLYVLNVMRPLSGRHLEVALPAPGGEDDRLEVGGLVLRGPPREVRYSTFEVAPELCEPRFREEDFRLIAGLGRNIPQS